MEYARVPDLALETNTYPRIDVIDEVGRFDLEGEESACVRPITGTS